MKSPAAPRAGTGCCTPGSARVLNPSLYLLRNTSAFTLSTSEVRVFRPLIFFFFKLLSDILHQNLIASNKCVNIVSVVCKSVGRMSPLSWSIVCLSVAGSDRLGPFQFPITRPAETEPCSALSTLRRGGSPQFQWRMIGKPSCWQFELDLE